MESPRILARTLVVDNDKVLLVRNVDTEYWYLPGGGWEYERESITECARREVAEETGYNVQIDRLLWLQEFHQAHQIFFETFWLAYISASNTQSEGMLRQHIDLDPQGIVEEARWHTEEEMAELKVYPARVKNFSKHLADQNKIENPFLGIFL